MGLPTSARQSVQNREETKIDLQNTRHNKRRKRENIRFEKLFGKEQNIIGFLTGA